MPTPPQPEYLTLDEAAEYMTAGTNQKWTWKHILQSATKGEISIWFRVPVPLRFVRTEPLEGEGNEIPGPAGFISRISTAACNCLIAAGVATYDGWDKPKTIDSFGPCKTLMREWMPAKGEVMPEIRPNDCSVSSDGINQLLTKYSEPDETTTQELNPKNSEQIESKKRHEDVKELANQLAPGSAKESSRDDFKPGSWEEQAYAIGKEWMLQEEGRTGQRPGVNVIAKHVAQAFKDKDIRSTRLDDYLSWETIKRGALKGITGRAKNGRR